MQQKISAIAGVVSLSLLLSACNSSEEEDLPLLPNATSSGVISGFGSVYVNGLRYVTENSSIIENGSETTEEALKVGMKVIIKANQSADNAPTAIEVKYIADAIGKIKEIDLAANSLTILEQTYLITDATKFDGLAFNELRIDDTVELSAFADEKGSFVVSYLTENDDAAKHQILGTVSKLSKITESFYIGSLLVSYADSDVKGSLSNGVKVSVKGNLSPNSAEFFADEVSVQGLVLVIGGTLTVSGVIDDIDIEDGGITIEIEGRKYLLTDDSDFTQGDEDSLNEGDQVSLIATVIQGESELQIPHYPITSIRVELENEVSLVGIVEGITDTGFILFGQEFTVDEFTQFEDDSAQELRYFNFSDIAIDDKLDIDAYEVDGVLISRKVEREETSAIEQDTHEIEGLVDSFSSPSFSVKGITILTDDQTEFEDAQGNTVNQADFFLTITEGDEVETEITHTENGWLALEVEIDSDDKDNDVELLGTIDTFTSILNFTVNSHQVTTNLQTEFENGNASNLNKGILIEVEGTINSKGELVAEEIEFIEVETD
jgi:predicted component of type VI protein secretion system